MKVNTASKQNTNSMLAEYKKDFERNGSLYLLVLPVILFYIIFCYKPMYGALMAFQQFSPGLGIWGSKWIGFQNFIDFFSNPDFIRIFKNTVIISVSSLVFGFPVPIILALLLNELTRKIFKSAVQTIMYLPHFISVIVICGMIRDFVSDRGIVSQFISIFTGQQVNLLNSAAAFVPIYVISGIWQGAGWGTIIYLAALSAVDAELYEAAKIDGAGKWKQTLNITIPAIMPTVIVMLILNMGGLLSIGYEKIILLYNPLIYETADVISSYVYRIGFEGQDWGYSTAIGLFNSVINLMLIITTNYVCRKVNETSLW